MSAKKKDNEDSVVIFKQELGQSKDDAWLFYDAKVIGAANNLHPDHAPFIFEQFDGKLPDWGLTSNVFFKILWDKSRQYNPGKSQKRAIIPTPLQARSVKANMIQPCDIGKTGLISFLSIKILWQRTIRKRKVGFIVCCVIRLRRLI